MANRPAQAGPTRHTIPLNLCSDRAGVTHVVEFTLALTFFLFILQAFSAAMDFRLQAPLVDDTLREAQLYHLVGHLTQSPGLLDNQSTNDTAWETYPLYSSGADLTNNLTLLGFAQPDRAGTLWEDKLLALRKLDYRQVLRLLGIQGQQLQVRVTLAGQTSPFMDWGSDFQYSRGGSTLTRVVGLANETQVRPARLQVWLFEGPNPKNKVVVTEVMHSPPGNFRNMEWVEIYNPWDMAVDLTGWQLVFKNDEEGFKPTQNQGYVMAGRSYAVIAVNLADVNHLQAVLNIPAGTLIFKINDDDFDNQGLRTNMTFTLQTLAKVAMDIVYYDPVEGVEGTNETMERVNPGKAGDLPTNWQASMSGGSGGSPGRPNTVWT